MTSEQPPNGPRPGPPQHDPTESLPTVDGPSAGSTQDFQVQDPPHGRTPSQGSPQGPSQGSPQGLPFGYPQDPPFGYPQGPPGAPQGPPFGGPQGPPPNWSPAGPAPQYGHEYGQQYGPQSVHPPRQSGLSGLVGHATPAVWILGLISLAAVVTGLTVKEDGNNAWHSVHAWGAVAIVGALLTLVPAVRVVNPQRARQTAACGAGALLLFWVLFVLPSVGSNTSLVVTVGTVAGVVAAWLAAAHEAPATGGLPPSAPEQMAPGAGGRPHNW